MSNRPIEFFIVDILIAIDKIKRYTSEFQNSQDFLHDEKSYDASMRELQIIGEASKYLLKNDLLDKQWQVVVDFRNVIIHEYFGIDIDEVWEVITIHLNLYDKEIKGILKNLNQTILDDVISSAKVDFNYSKQTIKFLKGLIDD